MERVFTFGQDKDLVGIATEVDEAVANDTLPAVIMLNAGLLHRVGPFRLHVELARRLAVQGVRSFRFDLSGIGDSQKHKDTRAYEEQIIGDIQAAMDFFTSKYGVKKFILFGLCTGAANAHKGAVIDPRVVGAIFLDGYAYRTPAFLMRRYGARLFSLSGWFNRIKRLISPSGDGVDDGPGQDDYFWVLPPKQQTEAELRELVERKVNLLYVYSGGHEDYNYAGQFKDMFSAVNFNDQLQVNYFPESDHTYILRKDKEKLIETISGWMAQAYARELNRD